MDTQVSTVTRRDHSGSKSDRDDNRKSAADFSHIKGWGSDLDHKNRPAYPMERKPPRLEGRASPRQLPVARSVRDA